MSTEFRTSKIKFGYYLEILTPDTMKLTGNNEEKVAKDKNGENVPHLDNAEVALVKARITGRTLADGNTKNIEIVVSLKYLSKCWRPPEMPLINCKINFQLTWPENCVITNSTGL